MPAEADGAVAAWYRREFPDLENRDRVWLTLTVHPARRRAGLGTALLRHAAERAAAAGRAIIDGGVREGSGGEAFALLAGATLGQAEVRRVLDLAKIPAGSIARLRESAARAAAGYSLVRWTGVTPDDRLDQVASLHNALNDAPMDPGVEAHGVDRGAGPRPHERPDRALPVPAVLAGGGARRQRRDGGADRGVGRPRPSPTGGTRCSPR